MFQLGSESGKQGASNESILYESNFTSADEWKSFDKVQ